MAARRTFGERVKRVIGNPKKIIYFLSELGLFNGLSDEAFLKFMYKLKFGKKLNLDDPKTFNEKLQWLKLHDRKPIYTDMVDKYEAKKYVADRIGEEYIIPTLGVWDSFDEIDFDALPQQFVLKCTHDSGGLVICRDRSKLNVYEAKKKIEKCLKCNFYNSGREWPYKNVKPRIIAEAYMEDSAGGSLTDYKFYCFSGTPNFLYVSKGLEDHSTAKISFLSLDWEFMPFKRSDYEGFEELPPKPIHYNEMLELAEKLSEDIPFLRVDLYEVAGNIYFSELTFSPCSGMMPFDPEEWDKTVGEWIKLPQK